jgi:HEAT repeat protein
MDNSKRELEACLSQLRIASTPQERLKVVEQMKFLNVNLFEILVSLLKDEVANIRRCAAESLGITGDKRAIPLLQTLYKEDKSWEVRWAAIKALGKLGDYNSLFPALRDWDAHVRYDTANLFIELNPENLLPKLVEMLTSSVNRADDRDVALGLCLSKLDHPQLFNILSDFLTNSDPVVVENATFALTKKNEIRSFSLIQNLLKNPDYHVRMQAVRYFGGVGGSKGMKFVISALDDPNYEVRNTAVLSLCRDNPSLIGIEAVKKHIPKENAHDVRQAFTRTVENAEKNMATEQKDQKKGWESFWKR